MFIQLRNSISFSWQKKLGDEETAELLDKRFTREENLPHSVPTLKNVGKVAVDRRVNSQDIIPDMSKDDERLFMFV